MVLYSILSLSSRHQAIIQNQEEHESSFYLERCLKHVIDALSASQTSYDDDLLSTVVLLRVYEEMEQSTDQYMHLHGMGRLLSHIPNFAHSGGLAEAACWQSLRQDIFVSLITARPPTLWLEHYDKSSAFKFRDDGACANVIVLIFAKILRLAHSPDKASDQNQWIRLEADVDRWHDRRTRLFRPIYEEEADLENDRLFPEILLLNAPQGTVSQLSWHIFIYLT